MSRILALDAALARASVGIVVDGVVVAERIEHAERGQSALLAPMTEAVLQESRLAVADLDHVAVTVGPGSFTGLRAALALATGMSLAAGRPLIGVTLADCFAAVLPDLGGRALWTAIDSRRGRVFLDRGAGFEGVSLDALPPAPNPVAVAGDAAIAVACRLAARGHDVLLTDARLLLPLHVATAALRRFHEAGPPIGLQPLYIDPPEARLPAGGLRPAPLP